MGQRWIDVRVKTSSMDAGELAGLLHDPWLAGAWQEDGVIHLYWPEDRWTAEAHRELTGAVQQIGLSASSISVDSLPYQDWNAAWARSVTPLRVGRRIVIRPSWETAMLNPGDVELILDPKQAFGTGHHATTQLLLEWLETHIRGGERVLDVGTGSGILAMVSLRLGAASARGIDHDPVAIECAREYAIENGFGPELILTASSLAARLEEPFDLVLANLDRRTLLDLRPHLVECVSSTGRLIVSGLLTEDRGELAEAFSSLVPVLAWEDERDGWVAMEFRYGREASA